MCFVLCQGFRASLTSPIEVQVLKRFFWLNSMLQRYNAKKPLSIVSP